MDIQRITKAEHLAIVNGGRTNIQPEHWPDGVRMMSVEGTAMLGVDEKGRLYLDGDRLYTAKRFAGIERAIGIVVAIGAISTACTAWLAYFEPASPPVVRVVNAPAPPARPVIIQVQGLPPPAGRHGAG